MKNMLSLLTLCSLFVSPAMSQTTLTVAEDLAIQADLTAVDTKAQQALDGTSVLAATQLTLEQRVTDLEAIVATQAQALVDLTNVVANLGTGGDEDGYHNVWYVNRLPKGAGNTCTMSLAAATVECDPNITDWEGDDTDVAVSCTSGIYDVTGLIYTATEEGTHTCHFMAADPRWAYATHNSMVTITVNP